MIVSEFANAKDPASTFTPIHLWGPRLTSDEQIELSVPHGLTTALVVLRGALRVDSSDAIQAAEVGLFDRVGEVIRIDGGGNATTLLLCDLPIEEPIVGRAPFVMNTVDEDPSRPTRRARPAAGCWRSCSFASGGRRGLAGARASRGSAGREARAAPPEELRGPARRGARGRGLPERGELRGVGGEPAVGADRGGS